MTPHCPRFEGVCGCPNTRPCELAPKWLTDPSLISGMLSCGWERANEAVDPILTTPHHEMLPAPRLTTIL